MGIFLTGGGDQEYFRELDQYFISQVPAPAKALIIPFAADKEDFDDIRERIEETFKGPYLTEIDLLTTARALTDEELDEYSAIFIEGGNTFQLIQTTRESGLLNSLKKFSGLNKQIYADSAGAILLGANIETAFLGDDPDEDFLQLQNYNGLDILNPWSIHAHYDPAEDEDLTQFVYDKANPIIAIPEEGGLLFEGGSLFSMGQVPISLFTFSGKEILSPGERFSLL